MAFLSILSILWAGFYAGPLGEELGWRGLLLTELQKKHMKYNLICAILILSLTCFISCDRPKCENENPIFEKYTPSSKIYKDELVNQLNKIDQSKLTYWLQKYEEQRGEETLYFNIQGDGLCAILHLTVTNWNKLEDVRKRKGVGRRGAEFTNLKFQISQDSLSTDFIYITYDRLID